jgi:hypothetical protein
VKGQMKFNVFKSIIILIFIFCLQNCAKNERSEYQNRESVKVNVKNDNAGTIENNNIQTIEEKERIQSRKPLKVKGIVASSDLIAPRKESEKQRLIELIQKSLEKDKEAFIGLIEFDCGGGAGCYDLGSVIVQIIYRIGERKTIDLVQTINSKQASRLSFLIGAGLEYGDNNYDDKQDNKLLEKEFPKLYDSLIKLKRCEECPDK